MASHSAAAQRRGCAVRERLRRGGALTTREALSIATQVAAALQPDTVLVSLAQVNNEIGVIQDIAAIGAICARHRPPAFAVWRHMRRCRGR